MKNKNIFLLSVEMKSNVFLISRLWIFNEARLTGPFEQFQY